MRNKLQTKVSFVFFIFLALGVLITGTISLVLMETTIPARDLNADVNSRLVMYEIFAMVMGFALSALIGYRYIKKVIMPIKELANITKRITRGESIRNPQLQENTNDEIGELSVNFNKMNEKLENVVGELQEKNSNMDAVLKSMTNGVIALDRKREIVMVNPYAEKIFGITQEQVKGKTLSDSVFSKQITENIESLTIDNPRMKFEAEITFPVYKVCSFSCSIMTHADDPLKLIGIAIIIQDITEIRKLENMRRDFVANVSHELQTPLTSIKGFAETLRDGGVEDEATRKRFFDIITIETDRLFSLIKDILSLAEIENDDKMGADDTIEPSKIMSDIIVKMAPVAKKRSIKLESQFPETMTAISGNRLWFQQMIINLLDNAVKYTPENGTVRLEAFENGENMIIKVRDTGMGIPDEDLPRIFERFYRVDKARSRQIGGTGLGLAIVKHIALSFSGKVEVESKLEQGSEFTITIPLKQNDEKNQKETEETVIE